MGATLILRVLCLLFACTGVASAQDCVVLLPGLGRTSLSMRPLAARLEHAGFAVFNPGYASRAAPIAELAAVVGEGLDACRDAGHGPVHFVGHSLGGILVRQYFAHAVPADVGRLVMLAPPNGGSEIVDHVHAAWWYRLATGVAGQELGTGPEATVNRLAPPTFDVGVIAGSVSHDPWFSGWLPGPDDGKVAVTRTRLAGMRDFLVVAHGHAFIMNGEEVAGQVVSFLRRGRFEH